MPMTKTSAGMRNAKNAAITFPVNQRPTALQTTEAAMPALMLCQRLRASGMTVPSRFCRPLA